VLLVRGTFEEVLDQEDAFVESLPREVRVFFDFENDYENFFEEQLAPFPAG
jgi:hypothetical protein